MKTTGSSGTQMGRLVIAFILVFSWFMVTVGCSKTDTPAGDEPKVLARVEVPGYLQDLKLPIHATLTDGAGVYYALVIATESQLQQAGVSYRVIDEYLSGDEFLLGEAEQPEDYRDAAKATDILYDDGHWIIVRDESDADEILAEIGFDLKLMSDTPITLTPPGTDAGITVARLAVADRVTMKAILDADSKVSAMIGKVADADVKTHISRLTGESPITLKDGGASYTVTVTTRHTKSGEPLNNAIRYVRDQLEGMPGMAVSAPSWKKTLKDKEYEGRNVVGELRGTGKPGEIVILIAHLDSINEDSRKVDAEAPGADDDASGCAALLTAAGIMSNYTFERTIRFVFATGEEQGTLGSMAYASSIEGQKVIAVINLDMIAYNTQDPVPTQRVKIRKKEDRDGHAADLAIANLFKDVVKTYGLESSLNVVITADGEVNGDQSSFWDAGIPAAWVIEDDYGNYNAKNMHTQDDKLQTLNMSYCTAQVKAALGTAAHLTGAPQAKPAPGKAAHLAGARR